MGVSTRILLLDAESDARRLRETLARCGPSGYELRVVHRLAEVENACRAARPDVIVTALNLPDSHGVNTVGQVQRLAPSTPVVVLSDLDDPEIARRVLELGAQDYLVRSDLRPGLLDRALRHAITRASVQRASLRAAYFDDLTGLPNRVLLRDRLAAALRRAVRLGERTAVFFVDLDRFKPVNDQHGHAAGDALLCAVAERLCGSLRASDTVARWGGDEFVCVLEGLDGADRALHLAANLHRTLMQPVELALGEGRLSLEIGGSFGVAVFPDHAQRYDELLHCADDAMYAAKRAGGGCVLWGSAGMRSLARPDESGAVPRMPRSGWTERVEAGGAAPGRLRGG
ncbi:MAG: GGDEF domain-containing response regulator [Polyangiales bacterium]